MLRNIVGRTGISVFGGNVRGKLLLNRVKLKSRNSIYATVRATSRVPIRVYHSSKYNSNMEYEKRKYDDLIREQLIKNSINNNPKVLNSHGSLKGGGLSFKTIIILIASSSTISMILYALAEIFKFQRDEKKSETSIFLPLWIDFNFLFQSTYPFPKGLKYFDGEYARYLEVEMSQLNTSKDKTDSENYNDLIEQKNITYTILEEISKNPTVRQIFGLPLSFRAADHSHFEAWIESKHPAISGIQIDLERIKTDDNTNKTDVRLNWIIKPMNFKTIIDSALVQAGLKLDRLRASDAQIKTHEKGSGRVHEVPLKDKHKKADIVLNNSRDYGVFFSGSLMIQDKNEFESGRVYYKGVIDFDHLLINRGIKLSDIEIIMKRKDNPSEVIKYKIK